MGVLRRAVRSRVFLVAVALAVGLSVSAGYAAIPTNSSQKAYACYPTAGTRTLRMIDFQAGERCTAGTERMLTWQTRGMRYRGAWAATTDYSVDDVVSYGLKGEVFVAVSASTGQRPATTGAWRRLAGSGLTPTEVGKLAWWQDPNGTATVTVGTNPSQMAFDGTFLWVTNNGSDSVSKIDPATGVVVATIISVGDGPGAIAFDGSRLWIANYNADTVVSIDAVTNVISPAIAVGDDPESVAFDGTNIWVTNNASDEISKIDPVTGTVVATVTNIDSPRGIVFDGTDIWVAVDSAAGGVVKIDPVTNALTTTGILGAPASPASMAFDGTYVWVADQLADEVARIDPVTWDLTRVPVGGLPAGPAYDGESVWVANLFSNDVTKIDPDTATVTGTIPATAPQAPVFDGANVWVVNGGMGTVTRLR